LFFDIQSNLIVSSD